MIAIHALLPPIEDIFQDVDRDDVPLETSPLSRQVTPAELMNCQWDTSRSMSDFLGLLAQKSSKVPTFRADCNVRDVVNEMIAGHHRWVIVRHENDTHDFFDYMDINYKTLKETGRQGRNLAEALNRVCSMPVGRLANCSGHSAYCPVTVDTPLSEVLRLISGCSGVQDGTVRRVPIVDSQSQVLHVFSCLDFLSLAMRFTGPTAVLKSLAARTFDRRGSMLQLSAMHDDAMLQALQVMNSEHLTICPTTSRELSGDMGGVVASNVVSVADLKWLVSTGQFEALNQSVSDFVAWRSGVETAKLDQILRQQRLRRFNVISVDEGDSLHMLAQRLLASKLQRIFLSSDEIARIVGIVSSRDILLEVLDQLP